MPIGTTSGKHYEDSWAQILGQELEEVPQDNNETPGSGTRDRNVIHPDQFFRSREIQNDPNNIYNDQGDIVDYATPTLKKLPTLEEFNKEYKTIPEMKQEPDSLFVPISDKKESRAIPPPEVRAGGTDDVVSYMEEYFNAQNRSRRAQGRDVNPDATERALQAIREALEESGGAEPVSRQGSEPGDRSHSPRQATGFEQTPFLGGMSDTEMMAYVQNNPQQALDPIDIERYDRLVPRGLDQRQGSEDGSRRVRRTYEEDRITLPRSAADSLDEGRPFSDRMKARISEAKTGKDLTFFGRKDETDYGKHYFANEKGVGVVNVNYRADTKTIKVSSVGIIENDKGEQISPLSDYAFKHGPGTFGGKETKQVLKYLKEKYPNAEWITGFRVSGARQKTGSGSDTARMWIGKGPKPKEPVRRTIEDLLTDFDP